VSRWDAAVADRVPDELRNRLGIAVAKQAYRAYRELLVSARWARLANEGARAQRLLWASTSVKDPRARDVLYVEALAAPFTVNTMPDQTLAGIDTAALAAELQRQGAEAFAASWQDLLARIGARHEQLARTS
jgi:transaldolase